MWSRRVLASAALFGFGTTVSLMHLIGELSYHTVDPRQALFYGGAAICAGVAVGLWLPRQIIIRRLRGRSAFDAGRSGDESAQADAEGAGPAASLVGVPPIFLSLATAARKRFKPPSAAARTFR